MFSEGQQVRVVTVEARCENIHNDPRAAQIERRLRSYIGQTGKVSQILYNQGARFNPVVEVIFSDGREANVFRTTELEPA